MRKILAISIILLCNVTAKSQLRKVDSSINSLQIIPAKYLNAIESKITLYNQRIYTKTEKTLSRLSVWEEKIHVLLFKVNPEAANRLFGNDNLTFKDLLLKLQQGEAITNRYTAQYDGYRDQLNTSIKYLQTQEQSLQAGISQSVDTIRQRLNKLNDEEERSAAIQSLIKERKKELISQSVQYIGQSKYLKNINKECWYYEETLRNYQQLFDDPQRIEQLAKNILQRIPAFQDFMQKNSMLASLFGMSESVNSGVALAGLQTRTSVDNLIQQSIASGGPNAMQQVQESMQTAQAEIGKLKDKLLSPLSNTGNGDLPDFKPNLQKSKTFYQRLEYGSNFQVGRLSNLQTTTTDLGLSVGYKISEKSIFGVGVSYKLGMGSFNRIRFSNEGGGFRSFLDWRLKRQFFLSGGMELNYLLQSQVNTSVGVINIGGWQKSALIGISKKISVKTKLFRQTQIQLLYNLLSQLYVPVSQPILFRVGYNF
jgi:hypothetical protein